MEAQDPRGNTFDESWKYIQYKNVLLMFMNISHILVLRQYGPKTETLIFGIESKTSTETGNTGIFEKKICIGVEEKY